MIEYGLCGRTLKHSYSQIIHEGLGNDKYKLYSLERDEFYELFETKNFKALNVTIPYKQDALMLCDVVSDEAKSIGSVNTVVNKDGVLYGYNTDYFGFVYMLEKAGISLKNKKVLILGSGGTSLTAQAVCKGEGAREYIVVSRRGKVNYSNITDHADADVIINTTPVGMFPDNGRTPVELDAFGNLSGVVDVIYNPIRTALTAKAHQMGVPNTTGLPMLVAQAVKAHEYFFDTSLDEKVIAEQYAKCLMNIINIVIVGMPGCGKSSVGKRVAQILSRSFLDTDTFVENCGMSIPEIFEKFGEEYFRNKETEAVQMLSAMSARVIATGGGAVIRDENVSMMRQNGVVVYLKRELEKLSTDGRPLSEGGFERVKMLYEQRHTLYENAADVVIETHEDVDECAERLVAKVLEIIPEIF